MCVREGEVKKTRIWSHCWRFGCRTTTNDVSKTTYWILRLRLFGHETFSRNTFSGILVFGCPKYRKKYFPCKTFPPIRGTWLFIKVPVSHYTVGIPMLSSLLTGITTYVFNYVHCSCVTYPNLSLSNRTPHPPTHTILYINLSYMYGASTVDTTFDTPNVKHSFWSST